MKMYWIFIALLLILAGCTNGSPSATITENQSSTALNTEYVTTMPIEEDIFFPLSQEEIINADLYTSVDDTESMKDWAAGWIQQNFKQNGPYDIVVDEKRSVSTENILEGMIVGSKSYEIIFKLKDPPLNSTFGIGPDGNISRSVVIHWVQDDNNIYLSGIENGGLVEPYSLTDYKRLYEWISGDGRFKKSLRPYKSLIADEGVTEYPIQSLTGERLYMPVMLSDGIIAYPANISGENDNYSFDLRLFDYKNEKEVYRQRFDKEKGFPRVYAIEGNLKLDIDYYEDEKSYTHSRVIDKLGNVKEDVLYDNNNKRYYLKGGACIIQRDNNLYLFDETSKTEKLLIAGYTPVGKELESEWPTVYKVIDENRFIYIIYGYEWVVRTGIYDISDFSDHVLSFEDKTHMYLLGFAGDRLYSTNASFDSFMKANELLITDYSNGYNTTMPCKDIPGLDRYVRGGPIVSPDGSSACAIMENGFGVTVAVYNESGIIKSWDIETTKSSIQSILSFTDEKVIVYGDEVANGEACLYEMNY